MQVEIWSLDRIKPYENNPRINDDADEAVNFSINVFGFRQPIVVDIAGVVLIGHTRFTTLRMHGSQEPWSYNTGGLERSNRWSSPVNLNHHHLHQKREKLKPRTITTVLALAAVALPSLSPAADITPARANAKEAYIYGYPMVDSYRIAYGYFVDKTDPEYKGPANEIHNTPRVYTPADKAIQTPNSDTPYSWLFMDLRTEPIVLTMPVIEKSRYFSIQLTDLYTFNWDYLGSRTSGNDGGAFMITGSGWKGEKPPGIVKAK